MRLRRLLLVALLTGFVVSLAGQRSKPTSSLWSRVAKASPAGSNEFLLNKAELEKRLQSTAMEIDLPLPSGEFIRFKMSELPVLAHELAAKFPEIRTYSGAAISKPEVTAQVDFTPLGVHAQILSPAGTVHIDPANHKRHNTYVSHNKDQRQLDERFQCLSVQTGPESANNAQTTFAATAQTGSHLRTYRLAIAASGEFTQANGGTVSSALSAIASIINRVNGIYQREVGIRFVLVANNNRIIFTNPAADPYSANAPTGPTLDENQQTIDALIGSANYDLGHLFNTAQYGVAISRVVCVNGWKARGCVGTGTPGANSFFVNYVAHEIAHQFGANHTFNATAGKCYGNRHAATAYEPGSGSTLMGYSGFCGAEDLQGGPDSYFHSASFDEITSFITTGSAANCAVISSTGNNPPTVSAGPAYSIPKGTPFTLKASGSDPDGDKVTFCWEQRDLGPELSAYDSDNGRSPLFRSLPPTSSPSRTFPRINELLVNLRLVGELLPQTQRTLNFRVTARDNRGGIATANTKISVANAGPFLVTSHNSNQTKAGAQLITWNVARTASTPVNASRVNIQLSTNGGWSFNTTLVANTPNDGAEWVALPNVYAGSTRIKVAAVGNIFFDINDLNFSIFPYAPPVDFNRDNNNDLVWQHSGGSVLAWFMKGTNYLGGSNLSAKAAAGWKIAGFGRFDADLRTDILFQHTDGRMQVWRTDGTQVVQTKSVRNAQPTPAGWRAMSAADFNGDGQTDILLQHTDGRVTVWLMRGTDYLSSQALRNGVSAGSGWRVAGTGDFNRDGHLDILFKHTDRRLMIWYMKKVSFGWSANISASVPPNGWQLVALTDFDFDRGTDLLWQYPDGRLQVWLMNGSTLRKTVNIRKGSAPSTGWQVVGPK